MAAVTIADTSPYLYLATFFFASSALSSDLLFIRLALACGFLFLILSSLSGYSKDGSFDNMPITDGVVDIPMFVNMILFLLHAFICARLLDDERPRARFNDRERALFRFFQSRCGLTPLQFQQILRNGQFVELPAHTPVPDCHCTLYLVCEGKVHCRAKFHGDIFGKSFVTRSGQFFDIKLFNLFSIPIGFDNIEFHAKTATATKLFAWKVDGLIAMRELQSPSLKLYWEYMVLRAVTAIAVRHHLKETDTLNDSLLIPESKDWLEGAPSRDFTKPEVAVGNWEHVRRQLGMIRASLLQIVPPHGIRHRVGTREPNPKQAVLENECRAAAAAASSSGQFHFLETEKTEEHEESGGECVGDDAEKGLWGRRRKLQQQEQQQAAETH